MLKIEVEEDEDKIIYFTTNRTGVKIYKFVIYKNATDKKFRLKIYEQYCDLELLQAINKKCEELGWIE